MLKLISFVGFVIVAAVGHAVAQDDSALDDASNVVAPAVTSGGELGASSVVAGAGTAIDDAMRDLPADLAGGHASGSPLAFATILADGRKASGTANVSSNFNTSDQRYEIAITGERYFYLSYATVITAAGDNRFCRSSSVGGKLLVYCSDASGRTQPARFAFVTFKP